PGPSLLQEPADTRTIWSSVHQADEQLAKLFQASTVVPVDFIALCYRFAHRIRIGESTICAVSELIEAGADVPSRTNSVMFVLELGPIHRGCNRDPNRVQPVLVNYDRLGERC